MSDASGLVMRIWARPLDSGNSLRKDDLPVWTPGAMMCRRPSVADRSKSWSQVIENRILTKQASSALDRVRPH